MEILYPENLIEKIIREEEQKHSGRYQYSKEAAKKVAFIYNTIVDYDDLHFDEKEGIHVDVSPSSINASVSVSVYDIFLTEDDDMKSLINILDSSDRIRMQHIADRDEGIDKLKVSFYVDNLWKVV